MDNQDNITITRRTEKSVNYKKAILFLEEYIYAQYYGVGI